MMNTLNKKSVSTVLLSGVVAAGAFGFGLNANAETAL